LSILPGHSQHEYNLARHTLPPGCSIKTGV
jgi:hypothetical protein